MTIFEEKHSLDRTADVSEHILVFHIISILIVIIALLGTNSELIIGKDFPHLNFVNLIMFVMVLGIIPYVLNKLHNKEFFPVFNFLTGELPVLLILFSFSIILFLHMDGHYGSRVLFLFPVIIAATSYGQMPGLIASFGATLVLLLHNVIYMENAMLARIFQLDLIFILLMFALAYLLGGFADIEKRTRKQLLVMANTDLLTGLPNDRFFKVRLEEEFQKAKKNMTTLALVMIDIDYFKYYKDNYGHQKGNEVLSKIGEIISEIVKEPLFPARYGGEEFIFILPGFGREKALAKTREIAEAIEVYPFEGTVIHPLGKMTVSTGIACFPDDADTAVGLLETADNDLYRVKYGGSKGHLNISALDKLNFLNNIDKEFLNSLKKILISVNIKDRYTFGHSERVMTYSLAIGKRLGLSEEKIDEIRLGAFVHDIGKMEVDTGILVKQGGLTAKEWETIKKHPVWGSELFRPLIFLTGIATVIKYHHENYDGTGYPDGLRGDEIPLSARIMRIVDSFDAMTTDRSYKKAKSFAETCREMKKMAGKLYDPKLVDIFLEIITEEEKEAPLII